LGGQIKHSEIVKETVTPNHESTKSEIDND